MSSRGKWAAVACLALLLAACPCLSGFVLTFTTYIPPAEIDSAGRHHAAAAGYDVSGSGAHSEYVTQPDAVGGCEIEMSFALPDGDARGREVAVRLRRPTTLHEWRTVSVTPRNPANR